MLRLLRSLTPKWMIRLYHYALSWLGAVRYRNPSSELIVIGVTGTNGKTTTSTMIAEIFQKSGVKTALMTTAEHRIGEEVKLNTYKQTMLGRFGVQRFLRRAVDEGCNVAVIETSSEGVVQYRHKHILYDACVFTNLTPEHLESHGGFEAYKQAKLSLFEYVAHLPCKTLGDKEVPRVIVVNADDEHASDVVQVAEQGKNVKVVRVGESVSSSLSSIVDSLDGVVFDLGKQHYQLSVPGDYNALNASLASVTAHEYGVDFEQIASVLQGFSFSFGRMEYIDEGQNFLAIVDYAHEPTSYTHVLRVAQGLAGESGSVHVMIGSCGGGRDFSRQPELGRIAVEYADNVVVTNEDPYDDDPEDIVRHVADGAREAGAVDGEHLFVELDRTKAITKTLSLAKKGDVCLFLGKGCEPWIMGPNGTKVTWDEREVVRAGLRRLLASTTQVPKEQE